MSVSDFKKFLIDLQRKYPAIEGRHNLTLNTKTGNLELCIRDNDALEEGIMLILSPEDEEGSFEALLVEVEKFISRLGIVKDKDSVYL